MMNATDAISDRLRVVVVVVVLMAGVGGVIAGSDRVTSLRSSAVDTDSTEPLRLESAPRSTFNELNSVEDIDKNASADRDAAIASGDVLILNFTDPELQSAMIQGKTKATVPTVRDLLSSDQFDLLLRQTDAESNAKQLNLSAGINNGATKLVTGGGKTYMLIDTRSAVFDSRGNTVAASPSETFKARVKWEEGGTERNASTTFDITPRTAEFDAPDGEIIVSASKHQTISGSTTLAPGSKLTVRVRSDGPSAFIFTNTTRVERDGNFSLEFDFSNVGSNVSFKLNVMTPDIESPSNGFITQSPIATVVVEDQVFKNTENQSVRIRISRFDKGGFVTIHDKSYLNENIGYNESLRGVLKVTANQTSVQIPLDRPYRDNGTLIVVPHFDTNENDKFEYRSNGGAVDRPYLGPDKEPIVTSASVTIRPPNGLSASSKAATDVPQSHSSQKDASGAMNEEAKESKNANVKTTAGGGTSSDGVAGSSEIGSFLPAVAVIGGGLLLGFLITVLVLRWKR